MKSIYKDSKGRRVMDAWYDRFVERVTERTGAPIDQRQVETRYGTTNVLGAGPRDAPELFCFHGAMATAPAALAQMPSLVEHFRVHFPDTIGQPGRSDHRRLDWQADDHGWWALDVLDGLGKESVTAFGVSLGGYVILRLASIAPERVQRAILWAPGGLVKPPIGPMLGLIWDGLMYSLRPSRPRLEKVLQRTFTDLDDEYVSFFADSLEHVHPDRRFPKILPDGALADWDAEVLLVVNQRDTVFPAPRVVTRAQTELPNVVETVSMPCAHMPPFAEGALDDLVAKMTAFTERE
jgi:pimeloyl-ACP methyl ester carboxylesterase